MNPLLDPAPAVAAADDRLATLLARLAVLHREIAVEFKGNACTVSALTMPERRWLWDGKKWMPAPSETETP